jgi:hypothetical protein
MWPFKQKQATSFGTGWWYNPQTNQAITVPANTDHYKFLSKNIPQFLNPDETPEQNNILGRWVQIRVYPSGELVIHFPNPTLTSTFRKTQDWLIGKVEPRIVAVGQHTNLGAVIQKPYSDWLNADSLSQFIQSKKGMGVKSRREARLAQNLLSDPNQAGIN